MLLREQLYPQAFLSDADRDQFQPGRLERRACADVSRVLHDRNITGIGKHAGSEVNRLLRSIDDYHLVRVTTHAARRSHIRHNGFAQSSEPGCVTMNGDFCWSSSGMTRQQSSPQIERQFIERGQPVTKGSIAELGVRSWEREFWKSQQYLASLRQCSVSIQWSVLELQHLVR